MVVQAAVTLRDVRVPLSYHCTLHILPLPPSRLPQGPEMAAEAPDIMTTFHTGRKVWPHPSINILPRSSTYHFHVGFTGQMLVFNSTSRIKVIWKCLFQGGLVHS